MSQPITDLAGYRPGHVVLDGCEGVQPVPCLLPGDGRTWNGWARPVFRVSDLAARGDSLRAMFPPYRDYEGTSECFGIEWVDGGPRLLTRDGGAWFDEIAQVGPGLYSIGMDAFTWTEVQP